MMTQSSWSWMMSGIKHLEGTDVDLEDWSCNMEIKQLTINVIFCEHDHGCVFVKNANLDGCSNVGCVDWFVENTAADYAANKKNWSQILLSAAAFAVSFLSLEHKTEVCHFFQLLRRHFSF